jgi:long-chain fatty acid transport protein
MQRSEPNERAMIEGEATMPFKNNICLCIFAVYSLTALGSSTALAGGFGNRLQSTIGAGLSFAGSGTDTYGLSGIYWNPAAVNTVTNFEWNSNYTFVAPYSKMKALAGTSPGLLGRSDSGNVGIDALVPGSYGAYRINPDWAVGIAVTAPFGLATKADPQWKGQGIAITSKAMLVNADAVIGYRVNDWLSVAVGPSVVYANARFSRDIAGTFPGAQMGTLRDLEDWGVGFTAGATIKPWQGGEIAIGYRSPVSLNLSGTLGVNPPGAHLSAPVEGKITLPDMLTLGFSQELTPQWTVLSSVEWKNWSRVQTVPFYSKGVSLLGPNPVTLGFHYRDGWNMALGAEYRWDEALTLRGGVAYEISPVDDSNRSTSIPDGDRFWLSGGGSYAFNEHFAVNLAYGHGFVPNGKIRQLVSVSPANPAIKLPFVGKMQGQIDVVSLGFDYKFGSDAVQKMPEAVVKP